MSDAFSVAIKMLLEDKVSAPLKDISKNTGEAKEKLGDLQQRYEKLKGIAEKFHEGFRKGAEAIKPCIDMAVEYDRKMRQLQVSIGGTKEEMSALDKSFKLASSNSNFSVQEWQEFGAKVAKATNMGAGDLNRMMPGLSNFVDNQKVQFGEEGKDSIDDVLKYVDAEKIRDPKKLNTALEYLNQVAFLIPEGLKGAEGQLKLAKQYFAGNKGIDDNNGMLMIPLLKELGADGKRSDASLVKHLTSPLTAAAKSALSDMGMADKNGKRSYLGADGKLDTMKFFGQVAEYAKTHGDADVQAHLKAAFGSQWGALAGNGGVDHLRNIGDKLATHGVDQTHRTLTQGSAEQEMIHARNNLNNLEMQAGQNILPQAASALSFFNDKMLKVTEYASKHPELTSSILLAYATFKGIGGLKGMVDVLQWGKDKLKGGKGGDAEGYERRCCEGKKHHNKHERHKNKNRKRPNSRKPHPHGKKGKTGGRFRKQIDAAMRKARDVMKRMGPALKRAKEAVSRFVQEGLGRLRPVLAKTSSALSKFARMGLGRLRSAVSVLGSALQRVNIVGILRSMGGGVMSFGSVLLRFAGAILQNPLVRAFTGGYLVGTLLSKAIDKGLQNVTGDKNTSLGTWIYDKLHPDEGKNITTVSPRAAQKQNTQIQVFVGGEKVAGVVAKQMSREASRTPSYGYRGDGCQTPDYAMMAHP